MKLNRFVTCCVIKIENRLSYNLSGGVFLLQGANITGNSSQWFVTFLGSSYRGSIFPTVVGNWFELAGLSNNLRFKKSGGKLH